MGAYGNDLLNISELEKCYRRFDYSIGLEQGFQLYIDMNYKGESLIKLNKISRSGRKTYEQAFKYITENQIEYLIIMSKSFWQTEQGNPGF